MAIRVKTTVVKDTATPMLKSILANTSNPSGLIGAVGRRVVNDLRTHFQTKESAPPKSGWPKGHLWARVARNTNVRSVDATQVTVGIGGADAGSIFLKRLNGGRISPKERKNLAIPITSEAAGKYPSANLIPGVFITFRRVGGQLEKFLATSDKSKPEGQMFLWVLKKSVEHHADPTALPTDAKLWAGINDTASKFIERAARRQA